MYTYKMNVHFVLKSCISIMIIIFNLEIKEFLRYENLLKNLNIFPFITVTIICIIYIFTVIYINNHWRN